MADPTQKAIVAAPNRFAIADAVPVTDQGVQIRSLAQMKVWAGDVAASGLAPKGLDTEGKVMLAAQTGMELGFSLMRALQAVVIINGRATLMGEAALGLIRSSGLLEVGTDIEVGCRRATEEEKLGKEGDLVGYCRSTRRGSTIRESLFTMADAQLAQLWRKPGPWVQYPKRMLMWRAVSFHMRDYWSDLGNGLMLAEEARDIPRGVAHARDVTPSEGTRTGRTDPLLAPVTDDPTEPEPEEAAYGDCWQCGHPPGQHPSAGSGHAKAGTGCLECSCELDAEAAGGEAPVVVDAVVVDDEVETDPQTGEVIPSQEEIDAAKGAE